MKRLLLFAVLALSCRAAEPPGLHVRDAFSRFSPGTGAAYLVVENNAGMPDRLVRVTSTVARIVELHETIVEEGLAMMEARPDGFVVPAEGRLVLEPGGAHVMLFKVQEPTPQPRSEIELTLHFERAGAVVARVPVRGHGE